MRKELMGKDLAELKTMLAQCKEAQQNVELPSGGKEEIVAWMAEFAVERSKMEEAEAEDLAPPNDELLRQLLKTYKLQVLSATGKSALMKHLSPIIKNWIRASSARAARGRAVDEEQPLVRPEDSVKCLVQQLWPALLASLEAQARHSSHVVVGSILYDLLTLCNTHAELLCHAHAQALLCR